MFSDQMLNLLADEIIKFDPQPHGPPEYDHGREYQASGEIGGQHRRGNSLSWDTGELFPNGEHTVFVGRDHSFGVLGRPWSRDCVSSATAPSVPSRHATTGLSKRSSGD